MLGELSGGIGLTFDTIKELEIHEINAKGILFIENLTAYHEFIQGKIKEIWSMPNRYYHIFCRKFGVIHKMASKKVEKKQL
jgi:hypothetical protein